MNTFTIVMGTIGAVCWFLLLTLIPFWHFSENKVLFDNLMLFCALSSYIAFGIAFTTKIIQINIEKNHE